MGGDRLRLCFGVHNHQPVGNFDHVMVEATERSYHPFLQRLHARGEVRLTAHFTGSLLAWLRERAPATFDLLGTVVARGQVELLTGGFYEPILAVLPDHDKVGQIERLTDFIKSHFGVRPRGLWLAERVWEPHLPRALREAGVEYALVDDAHFGLAGLDEEALDGYYLTEEQGTTIAIFPISQRLRYLIPFSPVAATVEYLAGRRPGARALTIVDDGEKFGVWPGTHAHVYEQGWLDRFFDALVGTPWLEPSTFADVVDHVPASGRIYLPTASYREMGEWSLPASAARDLLDAQRRAAALPDGAGIQRLLRGGFWRSFLVKYPEVADLYWKMLRLSQAARRHEAQHPDDPRLAEARQAIWRGQANDAYWHGVFGGCYLPHLRRAVRGALLHAERLLDEAVGAPGPSWTRSDLNGDGRQEIAVRTRDLSLMINPEAGGTLTEIGYPARGLDLADVLARRPEAYHDDVRRRAAAGPAREDVARTIHDAATAKETGLERLLEYDDGRRTSLRDGLFPAGPALDPLAPWGEAAVALGDTRFRSTLAAAGADGVAIGLALDAGRLPLALDKNIVVRGARVEAHYRIGGRPGQPLPPGARWAVQWNLALSAGDGPDRYFALPGRPALRSRGRVPGLTALTLVDEWLGLEAALEWSPAAEVAWAPVETVSLSEAGFERIYQGTAILITWPRPDPDAEAWCLSTALQVTTR